MLKLKPLFICLFLSILIPVNAQVDVNPPSTAETNFSPDQLINDILITGQCSTVSNISSSVNGTPNQADTKSYGYFKRLAGSNFPFEEGIVLTTGIARRIGMGSAGLDSPSTGTTDSDLSNLLSVPPNQVTDASSIEFDFVPQTNKISFRYIMASQEYQGTFPCVFADSFAFLLRRVTDTNYENIATLPGTTTPVSVTNVHGQIAADPVTGAAGCAPQNEVFFHGSDVTETSFIGRTVVLTAEADVIPNETYHIKLVIADFGDNQFDTAVFLEKGSFNLGLDLGPDATIAGNNSVCGTETLLTANIPGSSYKWFKDGVEIAGATSQSYLANLGNGTYTCEIDNGGGCTSSDDIILEFSDAPTPIPSIPNIEVCDTNVVDLTIKNSDVLNGQSNTDFEVLYYLDSAYTNQITSPNNFTITGSSNTIYVRKRNITAQNCTADSSFDVIVSSSPTASTPTNYLACDDMMNGGDTDGFFNNFILSTKDAEILGSLSPTQYNVSYHTTLIGAQTDNTTDAIDKNTPYRNTTANQQTIYVRIENVNNVNCSIVSTPTSTTFQPFNLVVNPLPVIINNPAQINQCGTSVGSITTINLTQAQISISNNNVNETFQYYPTENDAINDTAVITDPINYATNNGDSVWVRTITNNGCYRISRLNITVSFAGDVAYNEELTACDDFLDAAGNNSANNDDTDGITNFDLSPAINDIKLLFDPTIRNDLDILFFETPADRNAVINQISDPTNYRNTAIPANTQQTIYVKIVNKINNDCTGIGEFFIRVLPVPEFEVTTPQIVCLNNPSFIEAEMPNGAYTYEWRRNGTLLTTSNSEQLNITQGGTYEVTAINSTTLCRKSKEIIVNESIIASIQEDDVTIVDDSTNNSITINNDANNLGIGDYEFALQNENNMFVRDFQDTPFFENLTGGIYTILVRDKNNCGLAQLEVSILEFPDFFTPNGDGNNDVWNVKGISATFYPKSNIHIFDRFGKIITEINIDDVGWDGLYNGKTLPSSDYWFNIELTDTQGKTIQRKGHFSLLRK
ncbi:choice-of-anchor L domain-containing protein [Tenacibaculum amylolyticum]|uniref:choice-of-anchor L domain-containing protein n=1 Tax=Tenacibaculum amylolyticum TaxID=104269 RepID=UPI003893EE92